jgi:hypothetical protein
MANENDQVVQTDQGQNILVTQSKATDWSDEVHECAAQVSNGYVAIAKAFEDYDGHASPEDKQFALQIVKDMTAIFLTMLVGEDGGKATLNDGLLVGIVQQLKHKKAPYTAFRNVNAPSRTALGDLRQRTLAWEKENK